MSERSEYQPPPVSINFNRNVAGEEQHNNVLNVNESMVELIKTVHYEQREGKPMRYLLDDYEHDQMVEVPMDKEWQQMVLYGIGRERQYLEKQGIVFDFRKHKGGDTT